MSVCLCLCVYDCSYRIIGVTQVTIIMTWLGAFRLDLVLSKEVFVGQSKRYYFHAVCSSRRVSTINIINMKN